MFRFFFVAVCLFEVRRTNPIERTKYSNIGPACMCLACKARFLLVFLCADGITLFNCVSSTSRSAYSRSKIWSLHLAVTLFALFSIETVDFPTFLDFLLLGLYRAFLNVSQSWSFPSSSLNRDLLRSSKQ